MKVLITGGAGFIGSHLADFFIKQNYEVTVVDNFEPYYPRILKERNIQHNLSNPNYTFCELDIRETKKIEGILKKRTPDVIIHLAASAGVRPSIEKPLSYVDNNVLGTTSILEASKIAGIKKIVFASSSSIYGKSKNIPFHEDESMDHAISIYATSKQNGELLNRMYHNLFNMDVINLRFFTVYGPRQRPDLAINKFIRANLEGKEIVMFGDGTMARDYTFVHDTVDGIVKASTRVLNNQNLFETYNLGNSFPVSLTELIKSIEEITEIKMKIRKEDIPLGDVPITYANIDKAKKILGYNPKTPLKEGLISFMNWIKENPST